MKRTAVHLQRLLGHLRSWPGTQRKCANRKLSQHGVHSSGSQTPTVPELDLLELLGTALSERQIPGVIENIEK
jgi:hypothetical protein